MPPPLPLGTRSGSQAAPRALGMTLLQKQDAEDGLKSAQG